jgi:hypothetical protein
MTALADDSTSLDTFSTEKLGIIWLGRKDIDVNEHERLSNFTLRHKFK